MKLTILSTLLISIFSLVYINADVVYQETIMEGAWKLESQNGEPASNEVALLVKDGYFFYTEYRVSDRHFEGSMGGQYGATNDVVRFEIEFDTWQPERIGDVWTPTIEVSTDEMTFSMETADGPMTQVYSRIDNGTGDLGGAWRITDRMRNGGMQAMRQGPRKTIKMITGTRFQWAAYNPETKQFSGTGGGTIELKNGKYTENIEFFSRNKDRVGAQLTFDYKVNGIKWDHSGLSSSGNPIREIWTRQNQ